MKIPRKEIPRPDELKRPTLRLLSLGLTDADDIRVRLFDRYGLGGEGLSRDARNRFVNNHAWALVRL